MIFVSPSFDWILNKVWGGRLYGSARMSRLFFGQLFFFKHVVQKPSGSASGFEFFGARVPRNLSPKVILGTALLGGGAVKASFCVTILFGA